MIVVFVVFLMYRMRQGLTNGNTFKYKSRRIASRMPSTAPQLAMDWSRSESFHTDVEIAADEDDPEAKKPNEFPSFPTKAYIKLGLDLPNPHQVAARKMSARSISLYAREQTIKNDVNEMPPSRQTSQRQPPSGKPSSPVLPIGRTSHEFFEESDLSFQSRPTCLGDIGPSSTSSPPKVSRFSWTNSQVTKTPQESRFSVETSTSSVPRYRTVESWVGVQVGRIDAAKLQQHLRQQANRQSSIPSVPDLPTTRPSSPQPKKLIKQRRHVSDVSVFRMHPGTEIKFPRGSPIPSEILDTQVMPNAL